MVRESPRVGRGRTQAVLLVVLICLSAACDGGTREESRGSASATSSTAATAATSPGGTAAVDATGASRASRVSRPRIVVLGDSLTAGFGLDPEQAYPAILQSRVDAQGLGFEVINAGVSGDTSAGGLRRLAWSLDGDVRILVVALGANDGLRGLPVTELSSNLEAIIAQAQERKIDVLLAGMEAPPNFGTRYTDEFRAVYQSVSSRYHVALVPFLLEGVAGIDAMNQADGLHPTAEGARVAADNVWKLLEPLARARAGTAKG